MTIDSSKNDSVLFSDRILKEKQKFWENEGGHKGTGTKSEITHSSRGQYVSLFLVCFIASIALSSFVLFYVIGVK